MQENPWTCNRLWQTATRTPRVKEQPAIKKAAQMIAQVLSLPDVFKLFTLSRTYDSFHFNGLPRTKEKRRDESSDRKQTVVFFLSIILKAITILPAQCGGLVPSIVIWPAQKGQDIYGWKPAGRLNGKEKIGIMDGFTHLVNTMTLKIIETLPFLDQLFFCLKI